MKKSIIYNKRVINDLIICIAIFVIIFIILVYFEVYKVTHDLIMEYDNIELDEILVTMAVGNLIFSWFAYRRWKDFKFEFEKSDKLNKELTSALSARKRAQSALSICWRRFVDIAEMSPDLIWECDEKFHFKYVSDQFVTATGMSRKNILGHKWAEIGTKSGSGALCEKLQSRESFHGVKIFLPSEEGKSAQWMISGRPVFSEAGAFTGYRGIGTDIAEVKRVDDEAGDYSDHLEELVNLAVMDDANLNSVDANVKLTPREKEILGWVKQGKSYADIAEILSISRRTIEFHIGNVMNKLGASNRVSAVVIAMRRGILAS
ncbi:MAG: LuxR C-terminal-related transcriptional regulator [Alphaproteobacteria bacterium]